MKRLKKIKLSEISNKELETRQLKELKGGDFCSDKCGTKTPPSAVATSWWRGYF